LKEKMTRTINNQNTNTQNIDVIATKLDYIQADIREIKSVIKEVSDKQDKQDNRITSLETKAGVIGVISVAFTTIAASIATWIGVKN
jgi:peptidoglycan hydrolase CwlO-like protein